MIRIKKSKKGVLLFNIGLALGFLLVMIYAYSQISSESDDIPFKLGENQDALFSFYADLEFEKLELELLLNQVAQDALMNSFQSGLVSESCQKFSFNTWSEECVLDYDVLIDEVNRLFVPMVISKGYHLNFTYSLVSIDGGTILYASPIDSQVIEKSSAIKGLFHPALSVMLPFELKKVQTYYDEIFLLLEFCKDVPSQELSDCINEQLQLSAYEDAIFSQGCYETERVESAYALLSGLDSCYNSLTVDCKCVISTKDEEFSLSFKPAEKTDYFDLYVEDTYVKTLNLSHYFAKEQLSELLDQSNEEWSFSDDVKEYAFYKDQFGKLNPSSVKETDDLCQYPSTSIPVCVEVMLNENEKLQLQASVDLYDDSIPKQVQVDVFDVPYDEHELFIEFEKLKSSDVTTYTVYISEDEFIDRSLEELDADDSVQKYAIQLDQLPVISLDEKPDFSDCRLDYERFDTCLFGERGQQFQIGILYEFTETYLYTLSLEPETQYYVAVVASDDTGNRLLNHQEDEYPVHLRLKEGFNYVSGTVNDDLAPGSVQFMNPLTIYTSSDSLLIQLPDVQEDLTPLDVTYPRTLAAYLLACTGGVCLPMEELVGSSPRTLTCTDETCSLEFSRFSLQKGFTYTLYVAERDSLGNIMKHSKDQSNFMQFSVPLS